MTHRLAHTMHRVIGGGPDLKTVFCGRPRERRGAPFEADAVIMTDGAFTGLNLCMRTVTDPGDEVVFLSPPWFFYEAMIIGTGAEPVRVRVDQGTWDLDLDAS